MDKFFVSELVSSFFSFKKGRVLSPERMEQYREQVANVLANHPEKSYEFICTGNMFTFAFRNEDRIEVFQTDSYDSHMFNVLERDVVK